MRAVICTGIGNRYDLLLENDVWHSQNFSPNFSWLNYQLFRAILLFLNLLFFVDLSLQLQVNGGSLAEQAGLMAGDSVIKINEVDVYNLRHKEAQDVVVRSGNNFVMTVQRYISNK